MPDLPFKRAAKSSRAPVALEMVVARPSPKIPMPSFIKTKLRAMLTQFVMAVAYMGVFVSFNALRQAERVS